MQNVISTFNGLNGGVPVSRVKLLKIRTQAEKEGITEIVTRIDTLLETYPDAVKFELEVVTPVKETPGLAAARHEGLAQEGLDECGRLKKGYKYGFDGKIQKVVSKKSNGQEKEAKLTKPKKNKTLSSENQNNASDGNGQTKAKKHSDNPKGEKETKPKAIITQSFEKSSFAPEEWQQADTRKTTSLIKKYLKEKYGISVKVQSEYFSMGSSLRIEYDFGPDEDIIETEMHRLEYGRFDGMEDIYNHHDESSIGLILDGYRLNEYKYVSVRRKLPETFRMKLAALLSNIEKSFPEFDGTKEMFSGHVSEIAQNSSAYNWSGLVYQKLEKHLNFATQNEEEILDVEIHKDKETVFETHYYLTYTIKGKKYDTRKPVTLPTKMVREKTIVKNLIKFFDYSTNEIAVIGKLGEIEDSLKELGGELSHKIKFEGNTHTGYIFSKKHAGEVADILIDYSQEGNGLNFPDPGIKNPTIEEAIAFAEKKLIGKTIYHQDIGKKIHFTMAGIKKAIQGKSKPTRTRILLVFMAKDLVKKARLYKTEADRKKRSNVAAYHTLRTTAVIDKKLFEVIIKIQERKNGALYYDHTGVIIKKKQNSVPVDKSEPLSRANLFSSPNGDNKDNEKGLNSPNDFISADENQEVIILQAPEISKPIPAVPVVNHAPVVTQANDASVINEVARQYDTQVNVTPKQALIAQEINPKHQTLRALLDNEEENQLFDIPGDVGELFGDIEIKPKGSVVVTLSSPQGGGKTRAVLQFANALATNYRVKIFSLEEHKDSSLFKSKIREYIEPENIDNISAESDLPNGIETIHNAINDFDVIITDSWSKMLEIDSRLNLDQDFRKKYNGKLFIFIFQQTSDGKMYGGAKNQFDGDVILFVEKFPDYRESYIYPDKHRYTSTPLDQLKYNIFTQSLIREEDTEAEISEPIIL